MKHHPDTVYPRSWFLGDSSGVTHYPDGYKPHMSYYPEGLKPALFLSTIEKELRVLEEACKKVGSPECASLVDVVRDELCGES